METCFSKSVKSHLASQKYFCLNYKCLFLVIQNPYQTQGHHQLLSKQYLLAAANCNLTASRSHLVIIKTFSYFRNGNGFANKGLSSQGYVFFQWSCMDVRVGL